MKKTLMSVALVSLMFQGCGNNVAQPNTPVQFYTPSKLSVIKKGSKVYIQGLHDHKYLSKNLHKGIKDYFEKDNIFKIVNNKKESDIVISINTFYSYRGDSLQDTQYNKKYFVKRISNKSGGQDKLMQSTFSSSTGTLISTISIYDKKNLEPLVYFNIMPTDTSKVINGKGYASKQNFNQKFTQEVINKLNDLVSEKNKNVNVFLPLKSNPELKKSLLNSKFDDLFKSAEVLLPKFDIDEVSKEKYEDIKKKSSEKGSKILKRDLETDLSNFYVYFIAKESVDISAKNIKKVYAGYKRIMNLTTDESLILACANSLGRIEFKADRLKIKLGGE